MSELVSHNPRAGNAALRRKPIKTRRDVRTFPVGHRALGNQVGEILAKPEREVRLSFRRSRQPAPHGG